MVIEIIPQPKIKAPLWSVFLFVFCLILLLGFIATYFYFNSSSLKISQEIQNKEKALVKTPSEVELENNIVLQEQKINTFSDLISEHKKLSNIFDFLEKVCHPQIWFSDFNFVSDKELVNIKGQAANFVALGQQILILEKETALKKINLSEVSLEEKGGIKFSLQLTFDPQFLK